MPRKTMIEAIRDAMDVMMERDDNVVVFGEDVGYLRRRLSLHAGPAGEIRQDAAASTRRSASSASSAPPSAWRPTGCGPASRSSSPTTCIRPTTRSSRRRRGCATARTAQFTCPIVVRMPTGGGIFGGQTHSQSPEALFTHVCGLKTVVPSNPYDAKGLLIAAIEDPDPVIFLEPKRLYNGPFDGHHDRPVTPWSKHELGEVPDGHYTVPLGKAAIRREGAALTVLAYGTMVYVAHGGRRGDRHRRRDHRPAHAAAARPRHDRGLGAEDRPLRDRARGDADLRLRRGAVGAGAGDTASIISRRRSCASPAGTRPIRMRRNGTTSPARPASAARCSKRWRREMAEHVIKLPDVGEGVAEAELVEWHVKVGDLVREDAILAAVMTDKATVEIPSPVDGEIVWLGAEIGDMVAVGSRSGPPEGRGRTGSAAPRRRASRKRRSAAAEAATPHLSAKRPRWRRPSATATTTALPGPPTARADVRHRAVRRGPSCGRRAREGEKPLASPAVRLRAREAGIDLRQVPGTGPAGRITHEDLDAFVASGPEAATAARRFAEDRGRGDQGDRPAPQDRREDGGGATRASRTSPMSRRSTSPRSRSCGRRSTGRSAHGPAEADAAAVPDARHGEGDRRAAAV